MLILFLISAFLLLSLVGFLLSSRVDFAIILWPMCFGMDALGVVLLIAYRPARLRLLRVLPGIRSRGGA